MTQVKFASRLINMPQLNKKTERFNGVKIEQGKQRAGGRKQRTDDRGQGSESTRRMDWSKVGVF